MKRNLLKELALWLFARPPPARGSPLDYELCRWTDNDPVRIRDLARHVLVLGSTGSGKTSGSGRWLGRAIVNCRQTCGLILCAKPEDKAMWQKIFAEAGRECDLLVFEPGGPLRFNFLDYVQKSGGDTRQITQCITSIGQTLRSRGTGGREDGQFWEQQQERMLYCAVEVLRLALGRVTAPDLLRFITTAAATPEELRDERWQAKFHSQCMQLAFVKEKSAREEHDFELAREFFLSELPAMADRTRSSIQVGVLGILHVFNIGIVRELVSDTTNVSPDDMVEKGAWLLVNMPPAQFGDGGTFVNAGIKFLTEWRMLRRQARESDFLNVIWCDEAPLFVNEFDSHYLSQSRSHLGAVVFLSQSRESFYAALPGDAGKAQADALLGNFNLRIVHALGSVDTAEWASGLVGKELTTFVGGSMSPQEDVYDTLMGRSRFNGSFSQHYEYVLQPNVFMNGLRTGGPANRYVVDAIVIRSGEPFSHGQNYLWTSFSQR